jgi:hypothetical protein
MNRYLGDCDVSEGYVSVKGYHTVLQFTTQTENHSQVDLVLGDPSACPSLFSPSDCYGWHAINPTEFRLWTIRGWTNWVANRNLSISSADPYNKALLDAAEGNGEMVGCGMKKWFCLEDEYPLLANNSSHPPAKYTCGYQGLSPTWVDVYDASYPGQYIILDSLVNGNYILEIHVDPHCVLPDADRSNNSVSTPISWKG